MHSIETLCYPVRDGQLYLGVGQRSIVKGKRTGPGGKLKYLDLFGRRIHEPFFLANRREVYEETGVVPLRFEYKGVLTSALQGKIHEVHLFAMRSWLGEFKDSAEMKDFRPYPLEDLPYEEMWDTERVHLRRLLTGNEFMTARFALDASGRMESYDISWRDPRTGDTRTEHSN